MKKCCLRVFSLFVIAFAISNTGWSQSLTIERVLKEVEKNNKELQAYSSLLESEKLGMKSQNNLPDPHFGGYYMPYGEHFTSEYLEVEITQSMKFPSVYSAQKRLFLEKSQRFEIEYAKKRQEVLRPAQASCINLVHLYQQLKVEQVRAVKAKEVFDEVEQLYLAEKLDVIEYNKVKIAWLNDQFKIDRITVNIQAEKSNLKKLNGGNAIDFSSDSLNLDFAILDLETLWNLKLRLSPDLKEKLINEKIAEKQLLVSKRNALPELTVGYNYQGVKRVYYHGFYGGLTIPLWNSKNKVKAAQNALDYHVTIKEFELESAYAQYEKEYYEYKLLLEKYEVYTAALGELNGEEILVDRYKTGVISFVDYYLEIKFYHETVDRQLRLQRALMLAKAKLLDHNL